MGRILGDQSLDGFLVRDLVLELDVAIVQVGCDGRTLFEAGLPNGHRDDIARGTGGGGGGVLVAADGVLDGGLVLTGGLHEDATARPKFVVDFVHFLYCEHHSPGGDLFVSLSRVLIH